MACGTFTPSRGEGVTSPQQGAVITMLRGRPVPGHTPSGRRAHVARFREHGHGGGSRGRPPRASRAGGRRQASRPFAVPDRLRPTAPRQGRDRVLRHRRVLRARGHLRAAAVQAGGPDPHGPQPGPDRRGHAAADRPDLRPLVRHRAAAGTRPVRPLGVRRAAVADHRLPRRHAVDHRRRHHGPDRRLPRRGHRQGDHLADRLLPVSLPFLLLRPGAGPDRRGPVRPGRWPVGRADLHDPLLGADHHAGHLRVAGPGPPRAR